MALLLLAAVTSVLMLCLSGSNGMEVKYVEDPNVRPSNATKAKLVEQLTALVNTIKPDLKYDSSSNLGYFRGISFSEIMESPDDPTTSIFLNLYFYNPDFCGSQFSGTVRDITGQQLKEGFTSKVMPRLQELINKTYGALYVVAEQYQAGYYVQGTNVKGPTGCTALTTDASSSAYCDGYKSTLLSHTVFDTLYAGCQLQSQNQKYVLRMKEDCNAVLIDTTVNSTEVWSTNTSSQGSNCYITLQSDTKLAVYNGNGKQLWVSNHTDAPRNASSWFSLQSDRNMVIYIIDDFEHPDTHIWSSNTWTSPDPNSKSPPGPPQAAQGVIEINRSSNRNLVIILATCLAFACMLFIVLGTVMWEKQRVRAPSSNTDKALYKRIEGKPARYSFEELKAATHGFHEENKLGQGGFGDVYKGIVLGGAVVAIKGLMLSSISKQAQRDFFNEVQTISLVQHKNLVKLLGFCSEGEHQLLVYEYVQNNSLSQALQGNLRLRLSWEVRYRICLGVAQGLAYLHEESRPRIVHRDIKASNVLLDNDLNPKIADFGLARLLQDDRTHVSTRVAGTFGYLAPEYALSGHLTEKADVYSFGILVLELVSGRNNMNFALQNEETFLLEWVWQLYQEGRLLQSLDKRLIQESCKRDEVCRVLMVALLCTQAVPSARPSMSRVTGMLMGEVEIKADISKPGFLADLKGAAFSKVLSDGSSPASRLPSSSGR